MRHLLIIGCGDVARRRVPLLRARCRIYALARDPQRYGTRRTLGVTPVPGDLDAPGSLAALAGLAHDVVHFAPPPDRGVRDTRTTRLIVALARGRSLPQQLVYLSTSRVYDDCRGERVAETRPAQPQTACAAPRGRGATAARVGPQERRRIALGAEHQARAP